MLLKTSVTPLIKLEEISCPASTASRGRDDAASWRGEVLDAAKLLADISKGKDNRALREAFLSVSKRLKDNSPTVRAAFRLPDGYGASNDELLQWIERPGLRAMAQHETRGHMASDLGRYLFAAVFGTVRGYSPKAADFPMVLSPDHRNWHSGVFNDRFRVQLADEASITVSLLAFGGAGTPRFISFFQRRADRPDRHVVKVETVPLAGL